MGNQLNTSKDFNGWFSRNARTVPSSFKKDGKATIVEAVITTEQPAEVVDWERWEVVREVLLMDGLVMPDTKQVPLLNVHSRYFTSDVKGSIRNLRTEGVDLVGDVYFWSKAENEISQVEEGHLTDLSAGYKTSEEFTVELKPGEKKEINGRSFENNFGDKMRLLVRTKWWIKEGSLVPIGADSAAKFRSELQHNITSEDPDLQKRLNEVNKAIDRLKEQGIELENFGKKLNIKLNERESEMGAEKETSEKTPEQIRKEERQRTEEIDGIANSLISKKLFKGGADELDKVTKKAKDEDWSVEQFRSHVWGNLKSEDIVETPITDLDMSEKEYKELSVGRMLDAILDGDKWDKHKAGAEKEAIDEVRKRVESIPGVKLRGYPLPLDIFKNKDVMKHSSVLRAAKRNAMRNGEFDFGKRASDGVGATDAQYLIGTENKFGEFIDVLRNLGVAGPWGVRMISGAKQNISVPKKTSTGTFHWVAESGTGTATDFVIGQLTATPHNGWASMKRTRQAAYQSVPELDALIIDDILNNVITGRDLALLHGSGINNEPTGISNTSGIGDVVGVSLDWAAIVEFWTDIKSNNINSANLRFVTNALIAGLLMTRPVTAGQYQMLWDRLSQISAPPIVSEQVAANNLVFGDGAEAWMIDWGVIDLLVNPYKDDTGDVTITAFTAMDVLVSRASAFSLADDVS